MLNVTSLCCSYKELALLMLVVIMGMLIFRLYWSDHNQKDQDNDNDVTAVLPMWGRRTRRVQCLTQCSRWSSSPLPSSSSSSSTSSSSLTCSVPLLGDNHDDVGGLWRHLPNHLVWQADRRGTWSLLIYDQQFLTWFFSLFFQNFLTWAFFICYQQFVTQLISRCCSFSPPTLQRVTNSAMCSNFCNHYSL